MRIGKALEKAIGVQVTATPRERVKWAVFHFRCRQARKLSAAVLCGILSDAIAVEWSGSTGISVDAVVDGKTKGVYLSSHGPREPATHQ